MRPLISVILALSIMWSSFAQAANFYPACTGQLTGPLTQQDAFANRESKVELVQLTADNMITYLDQGQKDIRHLHGYLLNMNSLGPSNCSNPADLTCFFGVAVPMLHKRMRLMLAMSFAPQLQGFNLGDLDVAGNPRLQLFPDSPFLSAMEPMTMSERDNAQEELNVFWDGKQVPEEEADILDDVFGDSQTKLLSGVIENYIEVIKNKISKIENNPDLISSLRKTLAEFQATRRLKTAPARIYAAMLINDNSWRAYQTSRLEAARALMRQQLWDLTEKQRFLVYLTQANPTVADIDRALLLSRDDNLNFSARVATAKVWARDFSVLRPADRVDRIRKVRVRAAESVAWILSDRNFVNKTLLQRPDLCNVAEKLRQEIRSHEAPLKTLVGVATALPLLLLIAPIATVMGSVGTVMIIAGSVAGGAVVSYQAIQQFKLEQERYMARWTPDDQIGLLQTATDVRRAHRNAIVSTSTLVLSLGVPLMKTGNVERIFLETSSPIKLTK